MNELYVYRMTLSIDINDIQLFCVLELPLERKFIQYFAYELAICIVIIISISTALCFVKFATSISILAHHIPKLYLILNPAWTVEVRGAVFVSLIV